MPCCHSHKAISPGATSGFPLIMASEGERLRVVWIGGGCHVRERLLSMGLDLHDEITIVRRQGGTILIEKEACRCRYALGGGMAHKINVTRC